MALITLPFTVTGQQLECAQPVLAEHAVGSIGAAFSFSPEWDTLTTRTATFATFGASYDVALVSDACTVPSEVLAASSFRVSVRGSDGTHVLTTTIVRVGVEESLIGGDTPAEPTPSVYDQLVAQTTAAATDAAQAKASAESAATSASTAAASSAAAASAAAQTSGEIDKIYTGELANIRKLAGKNMFDCSIIYEVGCLTSNGLVDTTLTKYATTDFIRIDHSTEYAVSVFGGDRNRCTDVRTAYCLYDDSFAFIPGTYLNDNTTNPKIINSGSGSYIRISYFIPNPDGPFTMLEQSSTGTGYAAYAGFENVMEIDGYPKKLSKSIGKNLIDISASVGGYLANDRGHIQPASNYATTDYIPIVSGQSITFSPKLRKLMFFDEEKSVVFPLADNYFDISTGTVYTYTAASNGYVRASYYTGDASIIQGEYGTAATAHEAYKEIIEDGIGLNETMLEQVKNVSGNILYKKKWVSCGDSFTYGEFIGLTEGTTIESGIYAGKLKVYPYIIGNRNGMTIVNEAVSGSTMAYVDGAHSEFSTVGGRYTQIPSDADYITLYFGINDGHMNVSIGTIDDEVNTTFYGAWNIVMRYLVTKHPFAKIGIIVSNGMSSDDYVTASIAIAKKWGVSYLNLDGDYQVPLMLRTRTRTDTCEEVKNLRFSQFRCTETNAHPNPSAHEFEASFIENWLRSL